MSSAMILAVTATVCHLAIYQIDPRSGSRPLRVWCLVPISSGLHRDGSQTPRPVPIFWLPPRSVALLPLSNHNFARRMSEDVRGVRRSWRGSAAAVRQQSHTVGDITRLRSSVVEQGTHKPLAECSNHSAATTSQGHCSILFLISGG